MDVFIFSVQYSNTWLLSIWNMASVTNNQGKSLPLEMEGKIKWWGFSYSYFLKQTNKVLAKIETSRTKYEKPPNLSGEDIFLYV